MIGVSLIVEGWNSDMAHELHLKNYIYFAMAFSFIVELLNMVMRKRATKVVKLNAPSLEDAQKLLNNRKSASFTCISFLNIPTKISETGLRPLTMPPLELWLPTGTD
ncbi:hypothetical protein KRR40_21265 [Niabella defluvii]|nr:hypothetical protein KRR40_21265 [Niabella sp. I65]